MKIRNVIAEERKNLQKSNFENNKSLQMRGPGKGNTNNPNGRPAGVPNRTTKEAKEILERVLLGQVDNIKDALDKLKAKDQARYLDACSKLFTYVLPKKTDVTSDGEKIIPTISQVVIKGKNDGND